MKTAFYLNVVSPHQLPLAREIVRRIGEGNFKYVYAEDFLADRKALGWDSGDVPTWCVKGNENAPSLTEADQVFTGIRCLELMAKRAAQKKKTVYYSERWFKPWMGMLRLLKPSYFKMARRWVSLLRNSDFVSYLPMGIHAARDMARLCGLFAGDLRCLFRAPRLDFEKKPGGRIFSRAERVERAEDAKITRKYCLDKMRMWGYYVEPSRFDALPVQEADDTPAVCRVLWVGRLLNLKRMDAIVRAVGEHANLKRVDDSLPKITLDIYGTGPEENRLKKMAAEYGDAIKFHLPVPIAEVRRLMREHDVYVLASNGYEGWGAVVSEALEEGMKVIGTYEAGSSATMLPESCLFHAGDWRRLSRLLAQCAEEKQRGALEGQGIGEWTAKFAASQLTLRN